MKIVYIEWIDAASSERWQDRKKAIKASKCVKIKTVAFLIKKTKKNIYLSHSLNIGADEVLGCLSILKENIKKMKYL